MNDIFRTWFSPEALEANRRLNNRFFQIVLNNFYFDWLFEAMITGHFDNKNRNKKALQTHVRTFIVVAADRELARLEKQVQDDRTLLFGSPHAPDEIVYYWTREEPGREVLSDHLIKMAAALRIFANRQCEKVYQATMARIGAFPLMRQGEQRRQGLHARTRAIVGLDRTLRIRVG